MFLLGTGPVPGVDALFDLGVNLSGLAASMVTSLGTGIAIGIALMFTLVVLSVAVRWILGGAKKR